MSKNVLNDFFPKLDVKWLEPLDNQVIVQVQFKEISKLFILNQSEKRAEQLGASLGKVISKGAAAYKSKDGNRTEWPDYNVALNDYVIVPKGIGANYIWFKHPTIENQEILVISMADTSLKQRVTNPIKALGTLADLKIG